MAGHSKWHNIQHRKGAQDAKRGKIFTKLIKEIIVAAKQGGGAVENNPALRSAIDKALAANMKKDTIENAVRRGSGDVAGSDYEKIRYEGYSIGGSAVMVDCLTDNRNRTVAAVRHAFSKYGGSLGTDGSVAYLFSERGFVGFENGDEDKILEAAMDAGAVDVVAGDDGIIDVVTEPGDFFAVKDALGASGLEIAYAEITMDPANRVALDKTDSEKFLRFIDLLEDLDDVQEIYHNADIDEAALEN